jgi:hypothetical protein
VRENFPANFSWLFIRKILKEKRVHAFVNLRSLSSYFLKFTHENERNAVFAASLIELVKQLIIA